MFDRQCRKKGFKYYDIANGEFHTESLCKDCHGPRQSERRSQL